MIFRKLGITGGAGFVGTNLALAAQQAGYEVTLYDVGDRMGRLAATGLDVSARCRFLDLAKTGATLDSDLDVIVHLAALPQVDFSLYYPELVVRNNINSTINVLRSVRNNQIPLLFSSSIEVYGGNSGDLFGENAPLLPLSPYASSKISCENLVASYQTTFGIQATIFRLTNLYGPWQIPDRIIPRVAVQSILGVRSQAVTDRIRDFLHIADATRAILSLLDIPWGSTFNIAGGIGVELDTVVADILKSLDFDVVTPDAVDGRGPSLIASSDLISATTGWKPEINWGDGLAKTVDWYRDNSKWWAPFEPLVRSERCHGPNFLADHAFPLSSAVKEPK